MNLCLLSVYSDYLSVNIISDEYQTISVQEYRGSYTRTMPLGESEPQRLNSLDILYPRYISRSCYRYKLGFILPIPSPFLFDSPPGCISSRAQGLTWTAQVAHLS